MLLPERLVGVLGLGVRWRLLLRGRLRRSWSSCSGDDDGISGHHLSLSVGLFRGHSNRLSRFRDEELVDADDGVVRGLKRLAATPRERDRETEREAFTCSRGMRGKCIREGNTVPLDESSLSVSLYFASFSSPSSKTASRFSFSQRPLSSRSLSLKCSVAEVARESLESEREKKRERERPPPMSSLTDLHAPPAFSGPSPAAVALGERVLAQYKARRATAASAAAAAAAAGAR
jgi:hypothetical protein